MGDLIKISLNEDEIKSLFIAEINKRLNEIEFQSILMDAKQLCKFLSLSWPTVEKIFLSNPEFPSLRVGKKWLFNRKEVQAFIEHWSIEIKEKHDGIVE